MKRTSTEATGSSQLLMNNNQITGVYNVLPNFSHELMDVTNYLLCKRETHLQVVLEGCEHFLNALRGDNDQCCSSLSSYTTTLSLEKLLTRTSSEVLQQAQKWLNRTVQPQCDWQELLIATLTPSGIFSKLTLSLTAWNKKTSVLKVIEEAEFAEDTWQNVSFFEPNAFPRFTGSFSESLDFLKSRGVSMDDLPDLQDQQEQKFWLDRWHSRCCQSTVAIKTHCTSYGLKMMAENWIRLQGLPSVFLSDSVMKMFLVWKGHHVQSMDNKNVCANIYVDEMRSINCSLL